ncbi:MAG TPA: DUF1080 domain-containing protein [Phycisphaerales bacterium]|nr:DUF1080 domain-containing protein [Phycisphaerales bacterium]
MEKTAAHLAPLRALRALRALRVLRVPLLALALATAACQSSGPPAREHAALFDGATLDGWTIRGGSARYFVDEGAIVGETRPNTPNTFLCTARDYGDFVLELEVLVHPELNSGIQIRSHAGPDGVVRGYQVEIDPSPRAYSGGIYEEGLRGWLAPPTPELAADSPFRNGEWNRYRIEARGPRIRTWINDIPVADLADHAAASGFIALQVHAVGDRAEPLHVRWRNIRLRSLK